jgi:hypothetical protein
MRAFECLLSAEGRTALIEAALEEHNGLSIRRRPVDEHIVCENWRIGTRLRREGLRMYFDPAVRAWRTWFGFGSSATMIRKIVSEQDGCSWVWPEAGPPEDAPHDVDSNA